jgi:hypothetical protein
LLPENLQVIAVAMFECYYLKTLSEASRISWGYSPFSRSISETLSEHQCPCHTQWITHIRNRSSNHKVIWSWTKITNEKWIVQWNWEDYWRWKVCKSTRKDRRIEWTLREWEAKRLRGASVWKWERKLGIIDLFSCECFVCQKKK